MRSKQSQEAQVDKIFGTIKLGGNHYPVTNLFVNGRDTSSIDEAVSGVAKLANDQWLAFAIDELKIWPPQ